MSEKRELSPGPQSTPITGDLKPHLTWYSVISTFTPVATTSILFSIQNSLPSPTFW